MLLICTVSSVNGEKTAADIAVQEREGTVIPDVPFLNIRERDLPLPGDTVVAIFEEPERKLGRGFIIGVIR